MENIVFTIVAKNYLPLARALGWSLKNNNTTDLKFIIFLADEPDQTVDLNNPEETIIPVSTIGIENLTDWAFKYNVTEFCTSVKPQCFKYAFNNLGAKKAIYFDPDIFVFNNLEIIFNELDEKEIIITPHYVTPQTQYTGDQVETTTLFVGIYNFGFVAFKNTDGNQLILDWWNNRLSNQCYADRQDAFHTDQKWADFLPVYATETLLISKSIGYNLAPWNLFEREILIDKNILYIKNRLTQKIGILTFVHFAGYDPNDLNLIHKDFWNMPISKYPDYNLVRDVYIKITNQYKFKELRTGSYSYSNFSNGIYIQDYHRRMYRALIEDGATFNNPFNVEDVFYKKLNQYKVLSANSQKKLNRKVYDDFDQQIEKINILLTIAYKLLGANRYFLLMKLFNRYTRPENQVFLLKDKIKKIY